MDLLQRISDNDKSLDGLSPESYHLAPGEKINEAINRSWNRLSGLWGAFKTARSRLGPSDAGTTLTRERWLLPLFQELGFGRLSTAKAVEIEGKSYAITHRWQDIPLHLVGCGLELDKRTPGAAGAARISPHSLLQEYLNRSEEAQWGLLSNGLSLRILRDNATLTRQAYIDFDLESMFEGEIYSDFVLLWLVCHQSRFETAEKQSECILERWSKSAQERGTRALDDLRRGVEEAIVSLGQGFLQHPLNGDLRARLKNGELSGQDYYRQLLRLVYRLIFLFAAEDRGLLLLPDAAPDAKERYQKHYSTARLRALAERQRGSRHHDRYEALRLVMDLLGSDSGSPQIALPALGGFLFDPRSTADLNDAKLDNQSLLAAVRSLAFITERSTRRAVDYRNLGPEELGSVYESLLELHPLLHIEAGAFQLTSAAGNERKTTGSYYTPTSLIRVLLDSALDPVIEDRLKGKLDHAQQEQALLDLKVCDPACGSGHFLIAAAHRIAGRLAQARAGGDEPPPNETRRALRDVIRHCIYGVDINPMSVELCKVNLWLESLEPGKPLTFLDAHIQCGDSLVGVGPGMDISEIPDEAFNPVFGDDKATASALKKRNKDERSGQLGFRWNITVLKSAEDMVRWRTERVGQVEAMPEDDSSQVQAKAQAFEEFRQAQEYIQNRLEYNIWTSAFFWSIPKSDPEGIVAPTHQELRLLRSGGNLDTTLAMQVRRMAENLFFFHWELAFPKVFAGENPGFDCMLGNPPWERIKLQEEEFFAILDPEIAGAPNKAARQKLINGLSNSNPVLAKAFLDAKHVAECASKFVRTSQRYPLTAVGDVNTYALFAEHFRNLINIQGRAGVIVPTGIATDETTKSFFVDLIDSHNLFSIYSFENEEFIFPSVHNEFKFCLLSFHRGVNSNEPEFAFFCRKTNDLKDRDRFFKLSREDFNLLNPNSLTCPIFRTQNDALLTKKIYKKTPILINEVQKENPWSIRFFTMFHMSNDSNLFHNLPDRSLVPLYEAKMIWHFDHRFASFIGVENSGYRPSRKYKGWYGVESTNPNEFVKPRYWVSCNDVEKRVGDKWTKKWFLGFRDISSSVVERTVVFSLLPWVGVGNKIPLLFFSETNSTLIACFLANANSIIFDFIARQKIAGTTLNFFIVKQLPFLPPQIYEPNDIAFIASRVTELAYTAYDLKPFAEDMGYYGEPFRWDEERRALLRAELDAYYARLYGLNRKQLRYILDPADLTPRELEDILDPWEEVAAPLDPQGYEQRRAASDFPGETFRVLKEKENRLYGEYRTRRLVLEAWERLEGMEIGNPERYRAEDRESARPAAVEQPAQMERKSEVPVQRVEAERKPVVVEPPAEDKPSEPIQEKKPDLSPEELESQPMLLTDFGLYKCGICGKMIMGYEKVNHEREMHGGKSVEWKKMR